MSGCCVAANKGKQIRQGYNNALDDLENFSLAARSVGSNKEWLARTLHGMRRDIGKQFKSMTPLAGRLKIYYRNIAPTWFPKVKIGDRWMKPKGYDSIYGPSVNWLRKRGKTWDDIIESASRPSAEVNKAVGVQ